ncbi:hypothetical protein R3P38DRAFT_2830042 [Favolaschia claudopus]|uniref:Uncharacterized protein n=1 Tax=Favolaschia claudopus TaxID=2862362 RepID=A0AAW0EBB8_9AGAR
MSIRYPRIPSPESSFDQTIEPVGSRWRLLTDLNLIVEDDETSAETLLKAFDLSLYNLDSHRELGDASFVPTAPLKHGQDSFTNLPLPSSQNPFLSTPMRLKHFSKLSPSILRELLRSPSLPGSSFDNSLDIHCSRPLSPAPLKLTRPRLVAAHSGSPLSLSEYSLPLTPPPTDRIPSSFHLPDPLVVDVTLEARKADPAPTHFGFCSTAFSRQALSAPPHPNTIISPSAVRNYQKVIDEMRGVDSYSAQDSVYDGHEVSLLLLSSPNLLGSSGLMTPELDAPDVASSPPLFAKPRTLGALEDEFVALLQERATEEEEDAAELRALASRLEMIARGRRILATKITERKIEQQESENQRVGNN